MECLDSYYELAIFDISINKLATVGRVVNTVTSKKENRPLKILIRNFRNNRLKNRQESSILDYFIQLLFNISQCDSIKPVGAVTRSLQGARYLNLFHNKIFITAESQNFVRNS